jgi:hypothetical protein
VLAPPVGELLLPPLPPDEVPLPEEDEAGVPPLAAEDEEEEELPEEELPDDEVEPVPPGVVVVANAFVLVCSGWPLGVVVSGTRPA